MGKNDELRRLLEEHGIEWKSEIDCDTYWYGQDRTFYKFTEYSDGTTSFSTCQWNLTPKQVLTAPIAATMGAVTCYYIPDETGFTWWDENDVEHYEEDSASDECCSASCDKCGYTMMVGDDGWFDGWDEITEWTEEDGSEHKGYVLKPRFKHCPECGAKVVDE